MKYLPVNLLSCKFERKALMTGCRASRFESVGLEELYTLASISDKLNGSSIVHTMIGPRRSLLPIERYSS